MEEKLYQELHWLDKALDVLLVLGILGGVSMLVQELFFSPTAQALRSLHRADVLLLGIFLADITRTFFKSRSFLAFLKHQWFDIAILVIIITSFSTIAFFGLGRLSYLLREERAVIWLNRLWKVPFFGRIFGRG